MRPLSNREQSLIAVGLLVIALAAFWFAIIKPVADGFATRAERRSALLIEYAQNERLAQRIGSLRRTAEQLRALQPLYAITAPNAQQAAELLRERLATVIEQSGGTLNAAESRDSASGWVRASARGTLTNPQLVAVLSKLRNEQPYLVMEQLSITAEKAMSSGRLDSMEVQVEASIPFVPTRAR